MLFLFKPIVKVTKYRNRGTTSFSLFHSNTFDYGRDLKKYSKQHFFLEEWIFSNGKIKVQTQHKTQFNVRTLCSVKNTSN